MTGIVNAKLFVRVMGILANARKKLYCQVPSIICEDCKMSYIVTVHNNILVCSFQRL